jgi:hypothetical protein
MMQLLLGSIISIGEGADLRNLVFARTANPTGIPILFRKPSLHLPRAGCGNIPIEMH